ncbi:MAG: hypothetical protein E4H40_00445 [Candidatus Brocadiia bacterium]|nr:MAG: hypothetical protein E4H40_00445 [Candidatus Brocadiia bacterium]
MRTGITILTIAVVGILSGCNGAANKDKVYMAVKFNESEPLKYSFEASREVDLNWDPSKKPAAGGKAKASTKFIEKMTMTVTYTPVEIDPYGLTVIEAKCGKVKIEKSQTNLPLDAADKFSDKTFRLSIGPTGKPVDYVSLNQLVWSVAEKSFRNDPTEGRVKDPEMTGDFIATQWFLWDSVASVKDPLQGVKPQDTWSSVLSVPLPMLGLKARNATYTLKEIQQGPAGQVAVISSEYSPGENSACYWPLPYSGSFMVSGTFGFMLKFITNYDLVELAGQGEERFNIDLGRSEGYEQAYTAKLRAETAGPFGAKPEINIVQKFSMKLLDK